MMIIVIPEDIMNLDMDMIVEEVTVPEVPEVVQTVLEVVAGKYWSIF